MSQSGFYVINGKLNVRFKADQSEQKLRGGYYTPNHLADFATKWAVAKQPLEILEPSCGDGVFISSLHRTFQGSDNTNIRCIELDEAEAEKADRLSQSLGMHQTTVIRTDFLQWANRTLLNEPESIDTIIGNPPFIRYQFLEEPFQVEAERVFDRLGKKFSKTTNAWVPFMLASLALLKPGGRISMVIPSEIIHVMHAQSLRDYFLETCRKIVLIDPKEIWFKDTQQGTLILMAEKKLNASDPTEGVSIISVSGLDFLEQCPEALFQSAASVTGSEVSGKKWSRAALSRGELSLLNRVLEHPSVRTFKDIATVDVGLVTGANDFFFVDDETVERYGLRAFAHPMIGKSGQCPGILYGDEQHQAIRDDNKANNFLYLDREYDEMPDGAKEYIDGGVAAGYNTRYKCRIRAPWYKVPSVYKTNIAMFKRCHHAPRLILNSAEAYSTDTAYRITSTIPAEQLVGAFINPLTAIIAELEGRYYGGGVLELVPSEVEKLRIPIAEGLEHDLEAINDAVKVGGNSMEAMLNQQGERILVHLGFSKQDNEGLMKIWRRLRDKRMRKSGSDDGLSRTANVGEMAHAVQKSSSMEVLV